MVHSEDFRYNRVNMTAFRLVDSTSERVRALLREMEEISPIGRAILNQSQVSLVNAAMGDELFFYRNSHLMHFQLILAEPALIFDSVYAFAKGLERAVIDGPDLKMS